ncbi:MAG: hypothetical protein ABIJ65_08685, partial [Chloroflexota bacterium]
MRSWSLKAGDPRTQVLSADFRFCEPDYINDHTWEMESFTGENAVMGIRTTFGLRARSMRIFPGFTMGSKTVLNPELFFSPPILLQFYPNYLDFTCSPFQGLEARIEYWLPSSQTLASRLTFRNLTANSLLVQLEINAAMIPLDGQPLAPTQIQSVHVLSGKTSDLEPVVFLTGGPLRGPGPYSSLQLDVNLAPLGSRKFTWVQAALSEAQASFNLARLTAARQWDAELARIRLVNAAQTVDIETGDPDWDASLAFSQTTALRLFFQAGKYLPQPSFVMTRNPDHGYSVRTDGRDHTAQWDGQSILDSIYITSLLPGSPELAAGLVRNFLSTQDEKGFVDCRPGLAGQRSHLLAAPLLAELALNSYRQTGDKDFLLEVFPKLLAFFQRWFDPACDRDQDGFPEWDHPLQTGFEDNPAFNNLGKEDQGADIRFFESPALAASLWREYHNLVFIANELELPDQTKTLRSFADGLHAGVAACWNKKNSFYNYRDRDTHLSLKGKPLLTCSGPGVKKLKSELKHPARLLLQIHKNSNPIRALEVRLQGCSSSEDLVEIIKYKDFRPGLDSSVATSRQVYTSLEEIEVTGLQPTDKLVLRSLNYTQEDQTGFLPLWAGIPDEKKAVSLVDLKLFNPNSFWHKAGFSTRNSSSNKTKGEEKDEVHFPWNHLIGEGLLTYGWRAETSQLVTRLMETTIVNLKQEGAFFNSYLAVSRTGQGEHNGLRGLAPVGLFLQTLGVQIISPNKVHLAGNNPFPWSVTLRYRGLTVIRQAAFTDITFPDGQNIRVTDPA